MTQGSESARLDKSTTDTVLQRFEQWARDTPGAPAVIAGPESLGYGQLDTRANRLAHHLLASGLPPGGVVAIGTARQAELVVALLAVLKAGGAYTLIDVETPRTGQRQLAAARPFVLLTHAAHQAALDDGSGRAVIRLGPEASAIAEQPAERPAGPPSAPAHGRTAAVLFTGATDPRAVPVGHGLLLAAYESWAEAARLTPQDRHLITAGPDTTAFAAGWTRALCSGGALVLPPRSPWQPQDVPAAVESEHVTVLYVDPAGAVDLLMRDAEPGTAIPKARRETDPAIRSLRLLAVSGDRLHLDEQAALQVRLRPGARVLNVYGLAESAGTGTWFELPQLPGPLDDPEGLSLLGKPFPGCRVDVRDGEIHLTPPDGGDAIPTGDLGLLRDDGLLEFGGRLRDRITMPDGRTIDPYPIEAAIRGHEGVGAVIVRAVDGSRRPRRLVAYVTRPAGAPSWPAGAPLPDIEELRDHLAGKVLREETPRTVIRLRALPRNRAGQEDRDALPLPILPAGPVRRGGGKSAKSGKYGAAGAPAAGVSPSCAGGCGGIVLGFVAMLLTFFIWPGSTDLTGVPQPWAFLFSVLYLVECFTFGAGVVFLLRGRAWMRHHRRGHTLTTAAHLAVAYLLLAWWPQDNFYRLAAKQDWPRQAALVYTFNIPLMIAGLIVAAYVVSKPSDPFDFDD
uniref:AMP-binding protein n=1 Tax=Streptomyces sp. NBC_00049 TaxID=2903617 RepID=A0AAU2K055_9ACTN